MDSEPDGNLRSREVAANKNVAAADV